jgi:hypothetical protein
LRSFQSIQLQISRRIHFLGKSRERTHNPKPNVGQILPT